MSILRMTIARKMVHGVIFATTTRTHPLEPPPPLLLLELSSSLLEESNDDSAETVRLGRLV